MSRRLAVDLPTLTADLPDRVVRTADLRAAGLSGSAISNRCRPDGPWQRLLPGVLLLGNGEPSPRQRTRAALLYGGRGAMVTGVEALREHGIRGLPPPAVVHLLLPESRRLSGHGFVMVERTRRIPETVERDGLPLTVPARAAADAARRESDAIRLRALLVEPVRQGACSVTDLRTELNRGGQRGSAAPRAVLRSLSDGLRAAAEAWARRVIRGCPLPPPRWNVPVQDSAGTLLGVVDAWWDEVALAWDAGDHEFRAIPDSSGDAIPGQPAPGWPWPTRRQLSTTTRRHGALTSAGVRVVHTSAARLREDPEGIRLELVRAYRWAATRTRPEVYGLAGSPPIIQGPAPANAPVVLSRHRPTVIRGHPG